MLSAGFGKWSNIGSVINAASQIIFGFLLCLSQCMGHAATPIDFFQCWGIYRKFKDFFVQKNPCGMPLYLIKNVKNT